MAWAQVYTTSSLFHAGILEGFLESHDIPVRIVSAADSSRALTVGALAVVKIYVPSHCAVQAEKLLRAMEQSAGVDDDEFTDRDL